jgi:hypothetical protein
MNDAVKIWTLYKEEENVGKQVRMKCQIMVCSHGMSQVFCTRFEMCAMEMLGDIYLIYHVSSVQRLKLQ